MLICFEGIDGSGKTTVSSLVAARLRAMGRTVAHARENGHVGSRVAGLLRTITRDPENLELEQRSELMIYLAREAGLFAAVRPALERGNVVISDRFVYSHYALARARGLAVDLRPLVELAAGGREPDVVILLDCDPDVAWLRRRARKLSSHRADDAGRKGLVLDRMGERVRAVYHELAKARAWKVVDTTYASVEHVAAEVMAHLAPLLGVSPGAAADGTLPAWSGASDLESLAAEFFDWLGALAGPAPELAAVLLYGLESPLADRLRVQLALRVPAIVAAGLKGVKGEQSWRLRRALLATEPDYVARSLEGFINTESALEMREMLGRSAPAGVLASLAGMSDDDSEELRDGLWDKAPEAGLLSVAGLDAPRAWSRRLREFKRRPCGALAASLAGCEGRAAWAMRSRLQPEFPYSVLRGVSGLTSPRSWKLRREHQAVKAVLQTIGGLDAPEAWDLRLRNVRSFPQAVAASLRGLATSESYRLREALIDEAPVGVLRSLSGAAEDGRAADVLAAIVARHGGRVRVAREATRLLCHEFAGVRR